MNKDFWQQKWVSKEIGFHLDKANDLLVKHFNSLQLPKGSRIFLPLCGKTLDIHWLLAQGYHVAGSELIEMAVQELFSELGVTPMVTTYDTIKNYRAPNIDIYCGDFFDLDADVLGEVDSVYDRAALVALPHDLRVGYCKHLMAITLKAPQLIICFEYDESLHAGPPFSLPATEVRQHYENDYTVALLESENIPDGLKGKYPSLESIWLLTH